MNKDIRAYNAPQSSEDKKICNLLARAIDQHLPEAEAKSGMHIPCGFLDGNPIVGHSKLKDCFNERN